MASSVLPPICAAVANVWYRCVLGGGLARPAAVQKGGDSWAAVSGPLYCGLRIPRAIAGSLLWPVNVGGRPPLVLVVALYGKE
jgi:hypothetical protein